MNMTIYIIDLIGNYSMSDDMSFKNNCIQIVNSNILSKLGVLQNTIGLIDIDFMEPFKNLFSNKTFRTSFLEWYSLYTKLIVNDKSILEMKEKDKIILQSQLDLTNKNIELENANDQIRDFQEKLLC